MENMNEKRNELIKQARSLLEAVKTENRDLSVEERTKYDEAIAEIDKLGEMIKAEERVASLEKTIVEVPTIKVEKREVNMEFAEIRNALTEKRALTVNGTGAIGVVGQIVKEMTNKQGLLSKYRYFYGANAQTVIPVLSPGLATPAGQNEGATSVASDSTAVLAATTILPKAYVSILPVSAEAILMSGADIEASLPSVFAEAFGKAMLTGSLTGDGNGNNMLGMFVDAALTVDVSCAAAGAPKLFDVAKLALSVQDYIDDAVIIMNPQLVAGLIAEATTESAPIKAELMATRTIMGVPVVMSGLAPSVTSAGSVVAVAMSGSNYGVGVANALQIDPIKVKGDTNTYFQATMFFNGKPIVAKNGLQLKAV